MKQHSFAHRTIFFISTTIRIHIYKLKFSPNFPQKLFRRCTSSLLTSQKLNLAGSFLVHFLVHLFKVVYVNFLKIFSLRYFDSGQLKTVFHLNLFFFPGEEKKLDIISFPPFQERLMGDLLSRRYQPSLHDVTKLFFKNNISRSPM